MNWSMWSIDRILILFVSLAFLLMGIQVTMYHYRQNFNHKAMWVPVIASPIFLVVGLIFTWYNATWLHNVFLTLMWVGVVVGLIGVFFHFRGVGVRVGGWALRNFLIGPPIGLPLMFSALCVLGLIAMYWKAG